MSIKSVKEHLSIIAPDLEISEFKESTATVEKAANAHNVEKGKIVKTIALILEKPILLMNKIFIFNLILNTNNIPMARNIFINKVIIHVIDS